MCNPRFESTMIHFLLMQGQISIVIGENLECKSSAYLLSINWFTDILYLDLCLIFRHWCPDLSFYLWIVQVLAFIGVPLRQRLRLVHVSLPKNLLQKPRPLIWALLTHAWWLVLKLLKRPVAQSLVAIFSGHPVSHSLKLLTQRSVCLCSCLLPTAGVFLSAHLTAYEFTCGTHPWPAASSLTGHLPTMCGFPLLLPSHGCFDSLCYWQAKTIKKWVTKPSVNYIRWALSLVL